MGLLETTADLRRYYCWLQAKDRCTHKKAVVSIIRNVVRQYPTESFTILVGLESVFPKFMEFLDWRSLRLLRNVPDRPFHNLELRHQEIGDLYVVEKRRATDFEAPKL